MNHKPRKLLSLVQYSAGRLERPISTRALGIFLKVIIQRMNKSQSTKLRCSGSCKAQAKTNTDTGFLVPQNSWGNCQRNGHTRWCKSSSLQSSQPNMQGHRIVSCIRLVVVHPPIMVFSQQTLTKVLTLSKQPRRSWNQLTFMVILLEISEPRVITALQAIPDKTLH